MRRNPLTVAKDIAAALAVTQVTANLEVLTTAMDKPTNVCEINAPHKYAKHC